MTARYDHPVYGPDRHNAAMSAIAELAGAKAAVQEHCYGWSDYDSPAARERLRKALEVRTMYAGYGESFDVQYEQGVA